MFKNSIARSIKSKAKNFLGFIYKTNLKDSQRCENLTSIPGIGEKNCNNFYEAGYTTPESIIAASDKELLSIPGVGIGFIKRLRNELGRI